MLKVHISVLAKFHANLSTKIEWVQIPTVLIYDPPGLHVIAICVNMDSIGFPSFNTQKKNGFRKKKRKRRQILGLFFLDNIFPLHWIPTTLIFSTKTDSWGWKKKYIFFILLKSCDPIIFIFFVKVTKFQSLLSIKVTWIVRRAVPQTI